MRIRAGHYPGYRGLGCGCVALGVEHITNVDTQGGEQ